LEHAEKILRDLPASLQPASRRHVAQLLHRVLSLATYPARILKVSPIPRGFLPRAAKGKALAYLYPDEDARLMGCRDVPLGCRVLYGVLAREGMRSGEAKALTWGDVDLERGAVKLDENKSDDPRAWALDADVAEALRRWKPKGAKATASVFDFDMDHLAQRFRDHLEHKAKIDRPELFTDGPTRRRIRLHDLRATFVTLSLAAGRSESWVADRTGHRSSQMINRYRRAARTVGELGLGVLAPLVDAIPELAGQSAAKPPNTSSSSGGGGDPRSPGGTENLRVSESCAGGESNPYENYPTGT